MVCRVTEEKHFKLGRELSAGHQREVTGSHWAARDGRKPGEWGPLGDVHGGQEAMGTMVGAVI